VVEYYYLYAFNNCKQFILCGLVVVRVIARGFAGLVVWFRMCCYIHIERLCQWRIPTS